MRWPFVEQAKNKHVIAWLLLRALYESVERDVIVLHGEIDSRVVYVSAPALSSVTLADSAAVGSCTLCEAQSGR